MPHKTQLTPELAQRAVEVLDALPKPCLVQCSTATRAGAVLLLSLSKARNLNFEGAMQLAVVNSQATLSGPVRGIDPL